MNDRKPCGNYEALISYVYDECEPAERESLAAHMALCASCTEEIQSLRDTRAHLGAWSPPSLPLGFQITRAESEPAKVLRPAAWWRQPLPGWAQVAAAAVIFAAGMSVSAMRSTADNPAPAQASQSIAAPAASNDDLALLDARLRSVENAQAQAVPVPLQRTAAVAINERELFERVSALVDDRIAQSQRQSLRMIANVENRLDNTRGAMEEELLTYRQDIRRALPSLAVRVSATGDR